MRSEKYILELTPVEHKLLIECLNLARSKYIDEGKPIEDVNMLLVKAMKENEEKEIFVTEQIIHDEKNGLGYRLVGDYYLPMLKIPKAPQIGRFGKMHYDYIRNNKNAFSAGYGYPVS